MVKEALNIDSWHVYHYNIKHHNSIHLIKLILFELIFKPHWIHRYKNSERQLVSTNDCLRLKSFWRILKAAMELVMLELSRARGSDSFTWASRISGACSVSPVLYILCVNVLKSAVTFTVTSQHALCLPWDCCPWVWLCFERKGCRFFLSGCVTLSVSACSWSSDSHVSELLVAGADDGNYWRKTGQ